MKRYRIFEKDGITPAMPVEAPHGMWVGYDEANEVIRALEASHEEALRKAVNSTILACAKFNDLVDKKVAS